MSGPCLPSLAACVCRRPGELDGWSGVARSCRSDWFFSLDATRPPHTFGHQTGQDRRRRL